MNYKSTRDNGISVSASQAISRGISQEGGLFVPDSLPWLSYDDIKKLTDSDYVSRCADILGRFVTDFSSAEIVSCVSGAYTREKFETDSIAPIYELRSGVYMLELWHGPTCAFKDMALQLLPLLMKTAVAKTKPDKTVVILVATSGDTGKAALEGFKNVDGTKLITFYPEQGVSPMQKLQMTTQEGENVNVCAIKGNFDDAQAGVKAIFTDDEILKKLTAGNMAFSSANSINWGRLLPQIVYYISAYCDLIKNNRITCGEHVNIVVPTGNFGNILAAYYAKKMGIPVGKLICASNANNVLTDFLKTGVYDRNRPFYTTISPSMDILISSNLERLLYDLSGCDDIKIGGYMRQLTKRGAYEVDSTIKTSLSENFWAGFCDDDATRKTIKEIYDKYAYICDPHTAVAVNVYAQYKEKTGDKSKAIIVSTASPFKFSGNVLEAIKGKKPDGDEESLLKQLSDIVLSPPPKQIASLFEKPVRFSQTCEKSAMPQYILDFLGL
jgi:threonine synthase